MKQNWIHRTLFPAMDQSLAEMGQELSKLRTHGNTTISALRDSVAILGLYLQEYGLEQAPGQAVASLREGGVDEALLLDLTTQLGWDQLAAMGTARETGQERALAVRQSVRLWKYSPIYQWSVWLWTGWGLGDDITATLSSPTGQEWWEEFFKARRNRPLLGRDKIHNLSDWLLIKGNRFLALFTATKGPNAGRTTIRIIPDGEVRPIYNPDDKADVWFWHRAYTTNGPKETGQQNLYYANWETGLAPDLEARWARLREDKIIPDNAKRADQTQEDTFVVIYHISHNHKEDDDIWGWPLSTTSSPWVRGHKKFAESRLGVALAIAQFVRRSQVEGGSRAVTAVVNQLASTLSQSNLLDQNPPGAAGSWHVENKASDTSELSMRTGASDAKADNELFAWMSLLGNGLFPTSAGLDTSRWATALEMDKAQSMIFERYQDLWVETFQTLSFVVLALADAHGPVSIPEEGRIATISIDSFSLSDFPAIATAIGSFSTQMLSPLVSNGVITPQAAAQLAAELWRIALNALGLNKASQDLATYENFIGADQGDREPEDEDDMGGDETEEVPAIPTEEMNADIWRSAIEKVQKGLLSPEDAAMVIIAGVLDEHSIR